MSRLAYRRGKSYILGLDLGTGSIHCLLADTLGKPIATASAPMSYYTPTGCSTLAREFKPQAVVDALAQLVGRVLNEHGVHAGDISAIGVTSQRQGVVFLDQDGVELYCGPNVDLRAVFEGAAIDEEWGEEVYATTGHFPSFLLAPARLRWFREHRPMVYESTRTVLTIAGWLAYRLTGGLMAEPSLEAEAGLLDINTGARAAGLMEKLDVAPSMLPPLPGHGLPSGNLSHRVAESLGLEPGIPVVVAGPDTQCGLLGMGLAQEGQAGAVVGWSGAIQALTTAPLLDKGKGSWAGLFPLDGLSVAESNLGDAGNAYRWLKDILLGSNGSFVEAEHLASEASSAPEGVVTFLGPGPASSLKTGLRMGGMFFPSPLSFQETSRGQLFRAALENVAYSLKANLATLQEVTGLEVRSLSLGGGMSENRTLATTLANVLALPVRRSSMPQASARGAAMAASVSIEPSVGIEPVTREAAADCEEIEPSSLGEIAEHQNYYEQWLKLYGRLEWE